MWSFQVRMKPTSTLDRWENTSMRTKIEKTKSKVLLVRLAVLWKFYFDFILHFRLLGIADRNTELIEFQDVFQRPSSAQNSKRKEIKDFKRCSTVLLISEWPSGWTGNRAICRGTFSHSRNILMQVGTRNDKKKQHAEWKQTEQTRRSDLYSMSCFFSLGQR